MRPIKFRAWQKVKDLHRDIGMYEVADLVFYGKNSHGGGEAFFFGEGEIGQSSVYFEDLVLMQFTGLTDRLGVEIFESDLIIHTDFPLDVQEVHFLNGAFMAGKVMLSQNHFSTVEVIGNVHENGDLLK